jgi:hypothetical protein
MLEWSEYIENAERLASLNASERWTVNGVNALLAGQTVAWAGYGPGWASAIIFVGTWLALTFLRLSPAGKRCPGPGAQIPTSAEPKLRAERRRNASVWSAPRCYTTPTS